MGVEVIKKILVDIDLEKEINDLKEELKFV